MSDSGKYGLAGRLKQWWRLPVFILGMLVFMAWAAGAFKDKVQPGVLDRPQGQPLPAGAETFRVEAGPLAERTDVVGTVASVYKTHISSRLSAYVQQVHVTAGQAVGKGDPLVTLDDRALREDLAATEAGLKQAESEYQRTQTLLERAAATAQDLTAAEAAYNAARAQVERTKVMLTFAQLTSPMDGTVTDTRIESGDLANQGQVLMTVYDPANMRLEAPVPMRLVPRLALGAEMELTLDQPEGVFTGRVTEIVGEVDPLSRTRTVKIEIQRTPEPVLPGTFGRLWVREAPRTGIQIPISAVYQVGQLEMVQLARGDRAIRRLVRTGSREGDRVEILGGLRDGDTVLLQPERNAQP